VQFAANRVKSFAHHLGGPVVQYRAKIVIT
jgi:hypothetical protein